MVASAYWKCFLVLSTLLLADGGAARDVTTPWVDSVGTPQYFAVRVADMDQSITWYRLALGLRQLDDTSADDGSWRMVNLSNDALSVELIRDDRDSSAERPRGFAKVGFQVSDVESIADRVAHTTGKRPRVVDFPPHGIRILQIRDPDGNTLQFSSPLEVWQGGTPTDEVTAAVAAFGRAFREADMSALQTLLTDDYVHVNGGSGNAIDREEWLKWMASRRAEIDSGALVLSRYDVEDVTVRITGKTAVVTAVVHSSGKRNGVSFTSSVRVTNVWVEQAGEWRRAAFHDSALPESG
jgi:ketosteroid isomerase-like protein/catechol 2,3-dioxygenase-like lactoylglutathione lyase family enzyme